MSSFFIWLDKSWIMVLVGESWSDVITQYPYSHPLCRMDHLTVEPKLHHVTAKNKVYVSLDFKLGNSSSLDYKRIKFKTSHPSRI